MASKTVGEQLQEDNLGNIAISTLFSSKNYGHISVLISVYKEFFQTCPMMEVVHFPNCIELGGMQSGSLLPSYARVPEERSVNIVFPPPKNSLYP